MPKCHFNKVAKIALRRGCCPVNLLHIFRTTFPKNTFRTAASVHCNFVLHVFPAFFLSVVILDFCFVAGRSEQFFEKIWRNQLGYCFIHNCEAPFFQ